MTPGERLARDLAFWNSISQDPWPCLVRPDQCRRRYGWCFEHGVSTGTGPEVLDRVV